MNAYRVARPFGRWRYFLTLDDAKAFAERYYRRSGNVAAIEATHKRQGSK